MLQADVLALSSDTEQMPYVVLEAMDAGLPVASTDVGDVRLMLSPENRDFVVPPAPEALSGALRTLVEDPGLRKGIGRANQTRRRRIYTLPAMVKAHGDVLAAMVHRARIRAR
jgi:glycosyltransferase involved in cell wall biosynthesis